MAAGGWWASNEFSNSSSRTYEAIDTEMTQKYRCSLLLLVATIGTSSVARAQEVSFPQSPCGTSESLSMKPVFTGTFGDLKRLGSRSSLGILAIGGIAA